MPKLKEEYEGLKKVNSKTLQMVVFTLYNNLKALRKLKKNGKKSGGCDRRNMGSSKASYSTNPGSRLSKRESDWISCISPK